MCSGRVSSSCSTSGTRRVNLAINSAISHEWGKECETFTINSGVWTKENKEIIYVINFKVSDISFLFFHFYNVRKRVSSFYITIETNSVFARI